MNQIKRTRPQKWKRQLEMLPIKVGLSEFGSTYVSYQPDSKDFFNAHPEYDSLFKKFIRLNEKNNRGDIHRLWSFILNCNNVCEQGIVGNFAELGVYKGNTAAILAYYAKKFNRNLDLFDTFTGFDQRDISGIDKNESSQSFNDTGLDLVKQTIGENTVACKFHQGYFPDSITDEVRHNHYSIVSLDADLYAPTKAGIEFFYPRMAKGGIFFLHDYSSLMWPGSKKAIDEFCEKVNEYIVLMPDKSGSAFFRKSKD
jgi:hypothetical protein